MALHIASGSKVMAQSQLSCQCSCLLDHGSPSRNHPPSRSQRYWLRLLALALIANLFFWTSAIYMVVDIDKSRAPHKRYSMTALLIFILPTVALCLLVLGPRPRLVQAWSNAIRGWIHVEHYRYAVNLANALICLGGVIVYLYVSAIPRYNNAIWSTDINYQQYLPVPSFALIDWFNLLIPGNATQYESNTYRCEVEQDGDSNGSYSDCSAAIEWTNFEGSQTLLFDASKLSNNRITNMDDGTAITIHAVLTYPEAVAIHNDTSSTLMTQAFFDSRMSLETVRDCGLTRLPTRPSAASYAVPLGATYTSDPYGLISRTRTSATCKEQSEILLSDANSPYVSYTSDLDTSIVESWLDCDAHPTGDEGIVFSCAFNMTVRYETQMIQSMTSVPGISKLDIILNAGSIVGGIQFFAWFLAMFVS